MPRNKIKICKASTENQNIKKTKDLSKWELGHIHRLE